MPETLLIGSGNRDKTRELAALLNGLPWDVVGLQDYPEVDEPVEDGATFEDNALLKARYYGETFGVACVADDSGLEVDALNGAPGVYSARFAGENCSYTDNNKKLLEALKDVPEAQRGARFVCCAALLLPDREPFIVRGTVEGRIAPALTGEAGFGYDPLFIPTGETRSFAQMKPEEKHAMSHRGEAFRRVHAHLEALR